VGIGLICPGRPRASERQAWTGWPTDTAHAVPVSSRQMDVITIEGMMETFAAIVVTAVVILLVLLGIIFVEVLTGFILSFL
jgi:hypothetical protein